jgi:hypothetical protein
MDAVAKFRRSTQGVKWPLTGVENHVHLPSICLQKKKSLIIDKDSTSAGFVIMRRDSYSLSLCIGACKGHFVCVWKCHTTNHSNVSTAYDNPIRSLEEIVRLSLDIAVFRTWNTDVWWVLSWGHWCVVGQHLDSGG